MPDIISKVFEEEFGNPVKRVYEEEFDRPLLEGLTKVPELFRASLSNVVGGIVAAYGDIAGRPDLVEEASGAIKASKEAAAEALMPYGGGLKSHVISGAASALQNLSMLPIGLVSPAALIGLYGATQAAQSYGEERAEGASPLKAGAVAAAKGALESATEYLPTKWLLGGKVTKAILSEQVQEQVATHTQDFVDVISGKTTLSDWLKERPEAAYQTGVATAMTSAVVGPAAKVATSSRVNKAADKIADAAASEGKGTKEAYKSKFVEVLSNTEGKTDAEIMEEMLKAKEEVDKSFSTARELEEAARMAEETEVTAEKPAEAKKPEVVKPPVDLDESVVKEEPTGLVSGVSETKATSDLKEILSAMYGFSEEQIDEMVKRSISESEEAPKLEAPPSQASVEAKPGELPSLAKEGAVLTTLQEKGGEIYAEGLRGVEGQVYEGRTVEGQGTREGGENLQRIEEGREERVQGETPEQAPQVKLFKTKHAAQVEQQRLGDDWVVTKSDNPKLRWMVRIKTEEEKAIGTTKAKAEAETKKVMRQIGESEKKRVKSVVAKNIEEELFGSVEEAEDALQSLGDMAIEYAVKEVGTEDFKGYIVVRKEEATDFKSERKAIDEEVATKEEEAQAVEYEPMLLDDIKAGLAIDINQSGIGGANIVRGLMARIDDWFVSRKSGAVYMDLRDTIDDFLHSARGTPFEGRILELQKRLEAARLKRANDVRNSLSMLGGGFFNAMYGDIKYVARNVYSKLESIVERADIKINPRDLLAKVRKEVKRDELIVTQIEKFLEAADKQGIKLTRDEVLDYLKTKRLNVHVHILTEEDGTAQYTESWLTPGPRGRVFEAVFTSPNVNPIYDNVYHYGHIEGGQNLGWIRMSERIIDGKRTLYLQETQNNRTNRARNAIAAAAEANKYAPVIPTGTTLDVEGVEGRLVEALKESNKQGATMEDHSKIIKAAEKARDMLVPWAPFIKESPEFHIKWFIGFALSNGYEQIAVATGKQTKRLYGMDIGENIVAYIPWARDRLEGKYRISFITNTDYVMHTRKFSEEDLKKLLSPTDVGDILSGSYTIGLRKEIEPVPIKSAEGIIGEEIDEHKWANELYDRRVPKIIEKTLGTKPTMKDMECDLRRQLRVWWGTMKVPVWDLTDPIAKKNAERPVTFYSFAGIPTNFDWLIDLVRDIRNRRETAILYKRKEIAKSLGGKSFTLSIGDMPDIPAILPYFSSAHLPTSKAFTPFRHHIFNIAEAELRSVIDTSDTNLLLDEMEKQLTAQQVKQLTALGYRIDRILNKRRQFLTKQYTKALTKLAEGKEISEATIKSVVRDLVETKMEGRLDRLLSVVKDEAVKDMYLRMRNEVFEPYRKKMQNLMVRNLRHKIEMEYGIDFMSAIDAIIGGESPTIAAVTNGLRTSSDYRRLASAIEYYGKKMRSIDEWGEKEYWSAYMPGSYLIKKKHVTKNGKEVWNIVSVAKTLHEAKLYAEDYVAGDPTINEADMKIERTKVTRARHITEVFVGATKPTRRILKGLDNIFDTAKYYAAQVNRKVYLDPVKWEIDKDKVNMPRHVAEHISYTYDFVKGHYSAVDKILDSFLEWVTQGRYTPFKSATKVANIIRTGVIGLKLSYNFRNSTVNLLDGVYRVWMDTNIDYMKKAHNFLNTEEGKKWLAERRWMMGMRVFEQEGHITAGVKLGGHYFAGWSNLLTPMGLWTQGEMIIRPLNMAAVWMKYVDGRVAELKKKGLTISKEALYQEADMVTLESVTALQGINLVSMAPRWMHGPVGRLISPFRSFIVRTIEWTITRGSNPAFWAKYIPFITLLGGPIAVVKTLKTLPMVYVLCALFGSPYFFDELQEYVMRKLGKLSTGLPGLAGQDISSGIAVELPEGSDVQLFGAVVDTAVNMYKYMIEPTLQGLSNKEKMAKAGIRKIAPIARNVWDVLDATVDNQGWVRDENGKKVYNIASDWQKVMVAMGVSKGLKAEYQGLVSRLDKEITRFENMRADSVLDEMVNLTLKKTKGADIEKLMDKVRELHISPEAIRRRMYERDLTPAVRTLLKAEIQRRPELMKKYSEMATLLGEKSVLE